MSSYRRLRRNLKRRRYDKTVVVNRYPVKTGADEGIPDWEATPTVKATVKGTIQPATTQAQEAAGLVIEQGRFTVYCENLDGSVSPEIDRLELSSVEHRVLNQNHWPSHSEILVERVA